MKPTEKQMRAIENHISKAEQIKRLKTIFKHETVETCNSCGLEQLSLFSYGGENLCKVCDADLINEYFDKLEKAA